MRGAKIRPTISIGPPAANGTTIVTGRVGHSCATADAAKAMSPTMAAPARCKNYGRSVMECLLCDTIAIPTSVPLSDGGSCSTAASPVLPNRRSPAADMFRFRYHIAPKRRIRSQLRAPTGARGGRRPARGETEHGEFSLWPLSGAERNTRCKEDRRSPPIFPSPAGAMSRSGFVPPGYSRPSSRPRFPDSIP